MRWTVLLLIHLSLPASVIATTVQLNKSKITITNSGDSRLANGRSKAEVSSVSPQHVGLILEVEGRLGRQSLPCTSGGSIQRSSCRSTKHLAAAGVTTIECATGDSGTCNLHGWRLRSETGSSSASSLEKVHNTGCVEGDPCNSGGGGYGGEDECNFNTEESCGFLGEDPICACETPIFISVRGNRLALTNRSNGVNFDLNADGLAERIPWTQAGSDDVLLVIDRNGNGLIDDGTELFGNFSPQPPTLEWRNGFNALSIFDDPNNGGNGDGVLSSVDAGFYHLQLWRDVNHDGISQPGELRRVTKTRILAFDLDYRESRRRDRHGNLFRYVARILMDPTQPGPRRKFAVDVFFPPSSGQ